MPEISSSSAKTLKKGILIAGEQSGDNHGAALIEALKALDPSLLFLGVGGPKMRPYLTKSLANAEDLHIMGFSKVITALPRLISLLNQLADQIIQEAPSFVVTIDLPDFNIWLAKKLRCKGYKGLLVHYISPSVWAWRSGRIKTLAKHYDLLLTIFPFEPPLFAGSGLKTVYVGNPTLESVLKKGNLQIEKEPLIAIFPGSRLSVIKANLPLQIEAARKTGLKIAISLAHKEALSLMPPDVEIVPENERYELMRRAEKAIATSGTIALEIALSALPTVCTYKISKFNYFLAYYLFRIRRDFYVMPNILLKRMLIPEIIGTKLMSSQIVQALEEVNAQKAQSGAEELKKILENQADNNPSHKAAKEILDALSFVH